MVEVKGSSPGGLTIGELAARTGLAVSAIRHYEAEGLIHPHRTAGNQRRYDRADIRRLSFVMISQQLGFSLAEIRAQFAALPQGRTPNKRDWERISGSFAARIDARIASLTALRDRLAKCIGCGCLSLRQCRIYNHKDGAARLGQGPRYLMGDAPISG